MHCISIVIKKITLVLTVYYCQNQNTENIPSIPRYNPTFRFFFHYSRFSYTTMARIRRSRNDVKDLVSPERVLYVEKNNK